MSWSLIVLVMEVGYSVYMLSRRLNLWVVILSLIAVGCSSSPAGIPETLEQQIDKNVTFAEVLGSPDSYKGRLILLGGEVLKAKRLKEGTQVQRGSRADDGSHAVARASVSPAPGVPRSGNADAGDARDVCRRGQWGCHYEDG